MGLRPDMLAPGASVRPAVIERAGLKLRLGAATPGRLQLLLFERGHWCSSCRRHLSLVSESASAFSLRGVDLVAITHESEDAVADRVYPFPLIPDHDLALATSFDVAGVDEFGVHTIRPSSVVVDDDGVVVFSYVGDDSRDRPTIPALLLALDNLV